MISKKTYNLAKNMTSGHLGYTKIEKNLFFYVAFINN